MAENYSSFQGRQPDIDVNLFVNALTQGIAAGNAQKNTAGAIAEGVTGAIQGGVKVAGGIQAIKQSMAQTEAIQIANQEATAEGVPEARRQAEIAKGREAAAGGDPRTQVAKAEAQQKLGDLSVLTQLGGLVQQYLSGNRAVDLNSAFSQPEYQATFARNPDASIALLQQAGAAGLSPDVYNATKDNVFAVQNAKQAAERADYTQRLNDAAAVKNQDEFNQSRSALTKYPGALADDVNPNSLEMYPANRVKIRGDQLETLNVNAANPYVIDDDLTTPRKSVDDNVLVQRLPNGGYKVLGTHVPDDYQKYIQQYAIGANTRPTIYGPPKINGQTQEDLTVKPSAAPTASRGGGLADLATPSEQPAAVAPVGNPVEQAVQDYTRGLNEARKNGNGGSYTALMKRANEAARGRSAGINYFLEPQTTPTPPGEATLSASPTSALRQNLPKPTAPVGTHMYNAQHLSNVMGGANVSISLPNPAVRGVDQATIDKINSIPALNNMPAILKGVAAVESTGNPNAVNKSGAAGLMQFLPGTAEEMGISPDERFNPDKAVPAAGNYLTKQAVMAERDLKARYKKAETDLNATIQSTGSIVKADPRMVLASYNGGYGDIQDAIRAGNTTWETVKQYIIDNKSKSSANMKENFEYVDKVIAASIPFIVGGNTSDEAYLRDLKAFDIIRVS